MSTKIDIDVNKISDMGYNKNLVKTMGSTFDGLGEAYASPFSTAYDFAGGTIGAGTVFNIGSEQFKFDGKERRQVISDGATNRVLIGKRPNGTYGIDVSKVGYDVFNSYEGENLLSTKDADDWSELDPGNFTYSSATRLTISNYTPSDFFQVGGKIRIEQADDPSVYDYYYIVAVDTSYIDIVGSDNLANSDISELAIASGPSPSNFPGAIGWGANSDIDGTITGDGTIAISSSTLTGSFYMVENVFIISGFKTIFTLAGAGNTLFIKTPLPVLDNFVALRTMVPIRDDGAEEHGVATSGNVDEAGSPGGVWITIERYPLANFTATTADGAFEFTVQIPIGEFAN